jgi:hypothetical protein
MSAEMNILAPDYDKMFREFFGERKTAGIQRLQVGRLAAHPTEDKGNRVQYLFII